MLILIPFDTSDILSYVTAHRDIFSLRQPPRPLAGFFFHWHSPLYQKPRARIMVIPKFQTSHYEQQTCPPATSKPSTSASRLSASCSLMKLAHNVSKLSIRPPYIDKRANSRNQTYSSGEPLCAVHHVRKNRHYLILIGSATQPPCTSTL